MRKVSFYRRQVEAGLQFYCGFKFEDDKGEIIAESMPPSLDIENRVDYILGKDEYISGIYGQMHSYFGYIVKLGLITNKEHSVFDQ